MQVSGHTEMTDSLLDHGADVNKVNDHGLTPLSATIALLLDDRRPQLSPPGPPSPPASGQSVEGPRTPVDPAAERVGRLNVTRSNRAVLNRLLNDSPLAPPTVYFDAAGQMQTTGETARKERTLDARVADDKRAPAPQQQQQPTKPPSAPVGGGGGERPSPSTKSASTPGEVREEGTTNPVEESRQRQQPPEPQSSPADGGGESERPLPSSTKAPSVPAGEPREEKALDEKSAEEKRIPPTQQQLSKKRCGAPAAGEGSGPPSVVWIKVSDTCRGTREPTTIDLKFLEEQRAPAVPSGVAADAEETEPPSSLATAESSTPSEEKTTDQKASGEKRGPASQQQEPLKPQSLPSGKGGSERASPLTSKVSGTPRSEKTMEQKVTEESQTPASSQQKTRSSSAGEGGSEQVSPVSTKVSTGAAVVEGGSPSTSDR